MGVRLAVLPSCGDCSHMHIRWTTGYVRTPQWFCVHEARTPSPIEDRLVEHNKPPPDWCPFMKEIP
jgi:hypothetical protein